MSTSLGFPVVLLFVLTCVVAVHAGQETPQQRDARMKWWREARFGMFIHWGIYSVPAGEWNGRRTEHIGEWIMHDLKIPVAEYAAFARQFNPTKFDAEAWAQLAQDAGMKYVVITSKHHDGFAMYDSDVDEFNIVDGTPYTRDPMKELAAACAKRGIKFGFYYSQALDWHHPGGAKPNGRGWDASQDGDFDAYLRNVAQPQVREILNNYGEIAVLWWDTPFQMTPERAAPFVELLKLQPNIVTNDRLGGGVMGDTSTPEQHIPGTGFPDGRDWETCMTMNDTWGFKHFDHNWKSTTTLVRNLIDIASKGGNYLLNVGPDSSGRIPQESAERLREIGAWLKSNGEAIYGTSASPFKRYRFDGRVTVNGNRLFVHVFDWPAEGVRLVGLTTPVKSARLLASGQDVKSTTTTQDDVPCVVLARPAQVDPIATVAVLELDGPPRVDPDSLRIAPESDGSVVLRAADAEIVGQTARYESGWGLDNIGYWTDPADHVVWNFLTRAAGRYFVEVTYACQDGAAGSEYTVAVGSASASGTVAGTGAWNKFKTVRIGRIEVEAGRYALSVKATKMPHGAVMNLKEIKLAPAK